MIGKTDSLSPNFRGAGLSVLLSVCKRCTFSFAILSTPAEPPSTVFVCQSVGRKGNTCKKKKTKGEIKMKKRLKKKHESKNERKETEMQNFENLIPDDGIDRSVYEKPYVVKDGCLCEEVMTKAGAAYFKLCDYVPVLISEVTFDDGTEQKKLFLISAKHASGTILPEVFVSAEEMQNMKWQIIKWGALGAAEPRKNAPAKMCHAIMMTKRETVDLKIIYRQTGWRKIGGRYVFLMPNDNSSLKVELPGKLSCYRFAHQSAESDVKYLAQMLENPCAPKRIMYPLLALTFLSPLNHFLKAAHCEPKFVTALVGKTGSRKSTLTALMLSFFGVFTASTLPLSTNDTANSIIESAYYLKDVLTCVDDYHPAVSYKTTEMDSSIDTVCRAFGDRIGRGRLNSFGELQNSRPPGGNLLTTMEFAPNMVASGSARLFSIEIKENDVDISTLSEYQTLAENDVFNCIMQHYLKWIADTFLEEEDEFIQTLKKDFLSLRSFFTEKLMQSGIKFHPRLPETLAHFKIGFTRLLAFLFDKNMITPEQFAKYISDFDEILLELAAYNSELVSRDDPAELFCEKLKSLLDSGKCFTTAKGEAPLNYTKGYIGMEDPASYYLIADAVHSAVRSLCSEQGEHFSLTKNQLIKLLADENILVKMSGRNTGSVRLSGGRTMNVITLDKKAIESRLSRDVCPPSAEVGQVSE